MISSSRISSLAVISILLASLSQATLRAEEFEAVSSRTSPDYVREKLPDGSAEPEYYAFGKGGYRSGPRADRTIDGMEFLRLARVISAPLADRGYIPARDPGSTKLLIMVYWGTTFAPEHASESTAHDNMQNAVAEFLSFEGPPPASTSTNAALLRPHNIAAEDGISTAFSAVAAEDRARDHTDQLNAMLLGYDSWWSASNGFVAGTPFAIERRDMIEELEEDRYFVVLMAYDFQLLQKRKLHKLLWETRFSIREHTNSFDQALPLMARQASLFFGRDSGGLTHERLPEVHVDVGQIKDLGNVPDR